MKKPITLKEKELIQKVVSKCIDITNRGYNLDFNFSMLSCSNVYDVFNYKLGDDILYFDCSSYVTAGNLRYTFDRLCELESKLEIELEK